MVRNRVGGPLPGRPPRQEEPVTIPEAAERLNVSPSLVYSWVRFGKLSPRKYSGHGHGGVIFKVCFRRCEALRDAWAAKRADIARRSALPKKGQKRICGAMEGSMPSACDEVRLSLRTGELLTSADRMELERRRELFLKRRAS